MNYTQEQMPETHIASLATSASMVELTIGVPTFRKKDKKVEAEAEVSNGAAKGTVSASKKTIISKKHKAIESLRNAIRSEYHYKKTAPWLASGIRLLPNGLLIDYQNTMADFQKEFELLVDDFMEDYSWEIAEAQLKMGQLFDPKLYPPVDVMRKKFYMTVLIIPLPDSGDFRVDIPQQALEDTRQQYDSFYKSQIVAITEDIMQKLHAPLSNMSNMLDYAAEDKPTGFRDTLVQNVLEVVDVMKTCNVAQDPKVEQIRLELRDALIGVTPDTLRNSETQRVNTKEKVDRIIASLPSLDM